MPKGIDLELTQEMAIELSKSDVWKQWTPKELVQRQLFTKKLFVPEFSIFRRALDIVFRTAVIPELVNWEDLRKEFEEME